MKEQLGGELEKEAFATRIHKLLEQQDECRASEMKQFQACAENWVRKELQ